MIDAAAPSPARRPPLEHRHLGRVDYDAAWALQRELRQERLEGRGVDLVLTCEHDPPVLTAGRRARDSNLLRPIAALQAEGTAVRHVERGGDWTWHGPGQLVAYPIVRLKGWGLKVEPFVSGLERAMASLVDGSLRRAGAELGGVEVGRRCGHPGTWVRRGGGLAKIGAVGVHFRRFVSLHGLALNIRPDLTAFEAIVPCGLSEPVTSMEQLCREGGGDVGALPSVEALADRLAALLPEVWTEPSTSRCATFE